MSDKYVSFALSSSQTAILTGQKLQPTDPLYNMIMCFSINGKLDVDVFQRAFKQLVNACDALRTVIDDADNNKPQQRVFNAVEVDLPLVDLSQLANPSQGLDKFIAEHKYKPFDLSDLLYDSALLKVSDEQFVWYLNQHHIATDAWSMKVLFDKLQELYLLGLEEVDTAGTNQKEVLPSFEQYVVAEQQKRDSKAFQRASNYWYKQSTFPFSSAQFYAPNIRPRTGKTRRIDLNFGARRSEKLRELVASRFPALSDDMAIMQVFSTLLMTYLFRLSGQQHVSIGTPVHSRRTEALRKTTGLLISLFPLQVQVEEDETFASLYQKVAKANQNLLINALPGSGDVNIAGAFDVVLNYLPSRFGNFAGIPTKTTWHHADCGDRNHLLRLQVQDLNDDGEFKLCFDANEDKFDQQSQRDLCKHFLLLVDACFDNADCKIIQPSLVDEEPLVCQRNIDTKKHLNDDQGLLLPALERAAQKFADEVAVQQGTDFLCYQELAERSRSFAQLLVSKGIHRGDVVGVMLDRSINAVIAIQGILKAGAVFLPLECDYPISRIEFMLADAQAKLVVVDRISKTKAITFNTVNIDDFSKTQIAGVYPLPEIHGNDRAYLIYTSGSTGKPKGVAVSHQGLGNYIDWAQAYYLEGQSLSFALFSSLCFDLTITSLFVPLVSGGKLVVYSSINESSSSLIYSVIEDTLVDVIKLTPAHLALIQTHDYAHSRLKKLIVGGDDFKTELAHQFSRFFAGQIDIYNEYGPTEATVACTVHQYNPAQDKSVSVPIGLPISNCGIFILDNHLNRVPVGVIGQIYIGGKGLAEGYLNRQALTQECFIQNPYQPGNLMYRSGDLGFINEQGVIECVGRVDQQVKINGVRIETGEIESAMLTLEGITDVVVDVSEHVSQHDHSDFTQHCVNCGLEASHPSAQLDDTQTCRLCRIYLNQQQQAQAYFSTLGELQNWIDKISRDAPNKQDSIMLLSGGKDSSYALCKLVDMGLTPLVFTLDNGYISEGAKANVRRLVDRLGLELIEASTPAMNDIFKDSLTRFSNVCNGCFKTIYTLSMKIARERGIKVICTGLSRGQIFETRVAHLFQQGCFDSNTIDQRIIDARKAYHRTNDIVANRLDVKVFDDDSIFEEIQYLDFYRYTDVTLDEMYDYLNNIAPWIRPSDTGRSTNCLINDAGIYIHKKERGFHNYSLPYSWDVRLGHKQRDAALEELDDEIDVSKVEKILGEIGYQSENVSTELSQKNHLIGYYVAPAEILKNTLQKHLSHSLPKEFIPHQFVWMQQLPLTANGKVDRKSLPQPRMSRRDLRVDYAAPESTEQKVIVSLWQQILGIEEVGIDDNFFDLGGDSIVNIQIVAACRKQGIDLTPQQIFDYPTIRELSKVIGTIVNIRATQGEVTGEFALLPSQKRYLSGHPVTPSRFSQVVVLDVKNVIEKRILQESLVKLLKQHDGLRTLLAFNNNVWQQNMVSSDNACVHVETSIVRVSDDFGWSQIIDETMKHLTLKLDLVKPQLVALSVLHDEVSKTNKWVLVINHLVCDGVSWWILLNDLESCITSLKNDKEISLPEKTCSLIQWRDGLNRFADSPKMQQQKHYWDEIDLQSGLLINEPKLNQQVQKTKPVCLVSRLDENYTGNLLNDIPKSLGVQIQDVILTALVHALFDHFSALKIKIDIEGHGREELIEGLNTLRTVGWFTSLYPQLFARDTLSFDGHDMNRMKQWQRTVPSNGAAYALRPSQGDNMPSEPTSQVLFNYMGLWEKTLAPDSMFRFNQPIKASFGQNNNEYLLECNAMIFAKQLEVTFDLDIQRLGITAEQFINTFENKLIALIEAGLGEDLAGFTPSDFPSADVNQQDLDDIFAEFGEDE
ncbi:amino acid adenylation domain-containing protein [Aliiglaciecola sp.]|nr:amino acid adenylation domain-containing protein [Aliiglaciecola sp.]